MAKEPANSPRKAVRTNPKTRAHKAAEGAHPVATHAGATRASGQPAVAGKLPKTRAAEEPAQSTPPAKPGAPAAARAQKAAVPAPAKRKTGRGKKAVATAHPAAGPVPAPIPIPVPAPVPIPIPVPIPGPIKPPPPALSIAVGKPVATTIPTLQVTGLSAGIYTFSLTVTDDLGVTSSPALLRVTVESITK
jgi:hypothetical protein